MQNLKEPSQKLRAKSKAHLPKQGPLLRKRESAKQKEAKEQSLPKQAKVKGQNLPSLSFAEKLKAQLLKQKLRLRKCAHLLRKLSPRQISRAKSELSMKFRRSLKTAPQASRAFPPRKTSVRKVRYPTFQSPPSDFL